MIPLKTYQYGAYIQKNGSQEEYERWRKQITFVRDKYIWGNLLGPKAPNCFHHDNGVITMAYKLPLLIHGQEKKVIIKKEYRTQSVWRKFINILKFKKEN